MSLTKPFLGLVSRTMEFTFVKFVTNIRKFGILRRFWTSEALQTKRSGGPAGVLFLAPLATAQRPRSAAIGGAAVAGALWTGADPVRFTSF
jgi:hypothetical protein